MVTTGRAYIFTDLFDFTGDEIVDILEGQLVVRNVPDVPHGDALTEIFGLLYGAQRAGLGRVYTSTTAVALDFPERGMAAQDVTHPDLVFVRRERRAIIGQRCIEGVPDLIVEILSPTTRDEHAIGGRLRDAYERHGVPHYWLVDPAARTVEQYTLQGDAFVSGTYGEAVVLRPDDTLTSPLFPGQQVLVRDLFPSDEAAAAQQ